MYLAVYVDDLLIMGERTKDIEEILDLLKRRYKMKDLGIARRFLGMDIEYGFDGSIKLHLRHYLQRLLKCHSIQDCKPISTAMDWSVKLIAAMDKDALADPKEYQQIVGEIQFAAVVQGQISAVRSVCCHSQRETIIKAPGSCKTSLEVHQRYP